MKAHQSLSFEKRWERESIDQPGAKPDEGGGGLWRLGGAKA